MNHSFIKRPALAAFAVAGVVTVFTVGCAEFQQDLKGQANDTRQGVRDRIDARVASAENKVDQKTQEAEQEVDATIDRNLDTVLGDE